MNLTRSTPRRSGATARLLRLTALSCALAAGCSEHTFFKSDDLDFLVEDLDWSTATRLTQADGDEEFRDDGEVTIDGIEHQLEVVQEIEPLARGGEQTVTVTDRQLGQRRVYVFDPVANSLSFSDGTSSLRVVQNPDKSYTVNGSPAANGKAAVALMKQSPVYTEASKWGYAMTYAVCQSCVQQAASRGGLICGNGGGAQGADPPAVCDTFRDLCDCSICDKLGRASCQRCP